jgi:transcriptional regulator with XRE-family HTH domain
VDEAGRKAFGEQIKSWRERLGLSQHDVDKAIGKTSRGFTAQVETGRLAPLPRDVCSAYDQALKRTDGEVWALSAPLRLQDFDPDLWDWHRSQLDQARGAPLSPDEEQMVEAMRRSTAIRDLLEMVEILQRAVRRYVDCQAALDPQRPRVLVEDSFGINVARALTAFLRGAFELAPLARGEGSEQERAARQDEQLARDLHILLRRVSELPPGQQADLMGLWSTAAEAVWRAWRSELGSSQHTLRHRLLAASELEEEDIDRFLKEDEGRKAARQGPEAKA